MTIPTAGPAAQHDNAAPQPSPLLEVPGAVAANEPDGAVAWHYGDPTREQRLLAAGQAVVDLSHRGVVRVTGPDRRSWLHSLTSQQLTDLGPGTGTESLVLSPHGHVEHALHMVDDGEALWLTVEPGTAPALVEWLDRMRFMLRVDVTDVTADWAVLGMVVAPGAPVPSGLALPDAVPPALSDAVPPAWQDPWPGPDDLVAGHTASYASIEAAEHPGHARPWREVLVPRADLRAVVADVALAGTWAAEALRVAAWRPRLGFESDHRTIPHEADWLRSAVHLQKGCYRGQETVARVHNLGKPPRRLVMLHLDGSEHTLPEHGAPVVLGERQIGFITTAARHHELGPIALALIKRSTPEEATLTVDGTPASQEVIVAR